MKKSFMTRVLAVSLSAAMAFSMSSASNLMTASAASTVNLKTTFKTLKVNQTYKMTLKNNTLNWKITKVTTSNKSICTVYGKTASSVMLKGKGVGRAKITVKVKTTKRKYPKNIKLMKCTANVKAADTPSTEAFSATATANGNTEVNVKFSQAIDTPETTNFTVSDNVSVNGIKLSDDKMTATLTIAGAEYDKTYDLTVTGIKVAGVEQAEQKLTFKTPAATEEYPVTLEPEKTTLKSDGASQTVVTFTIKDKNGNLVTDKGIEVLFTASIGRFAEQRVTVENGVATNVYTSAALMETTNADITATVVESTSNQELLGRNASNKIKLSPRGEEGNTAIGAIITSVTAPTADRVYAYFNQEVDASDFLKEKSKRLDTSKFECTVYSGLDNNSSSADYNSSDERIQKTTVIGVLPVEEDPTALQLLVADPMVDNSNIEVTFTNKLNSDSLIAAKNTVTTKLTDARQPSALNVTSDGKREITVEFSEAVLATEDCDGFGRGDQGESAFAADKVENYRIDGRPLSYYGISAIEVESEGTDDTNGTLQRESTADHNPGKDATTGTIQIKHYEKGVDNRSKVTIKLGPDARRLLSAGQHSLEISNVGDWAAKTDKERNILNTQVLHFNLEDNNETPTFTVEEESPEQYKVVFNTDFDLVESGDTVKTPNSATTDNWNSIIKLQQRDGNSWKTISDSEGSGNNPIRVSKINGTSESNAYMVEVTEDWTQVYKTNSTRKNYYNYQLRLHIDAGKIVNVVNNRQNQEINVELDDDVIMRNMDVKSPAILNVESAEDTNGNLLSSYNVTFDEPVKMSKEANLEGLTPSETQQAWAERADDGNMGIPAPSAQFVNEDSSTTIDGYVTDDAFVDASDKVINIEPSKPLAPGRWRVVVSSVSDDYGNTAQTAVNYVDVAGETSDTDFKIVWAAVSATPEYDATANYGLNSYGRYIFVKFNKPINLVGNSANALVSGNYLIDGATLPTGTNVWAKIQNYDDAEGIKGITDSITIELPQGRYNTASDYTVSASNTILNVSKAITSATGETLSGATNIRLPYNWGAAAGTQSGGTVSSLNTKTDAVWGNYIVSGDNNDETDGSDKEYFEKLKAALENDQYRKVILTRDLALDSKDAEDVFGKSHTLTINRAVDFVVNGNITGGNVEVVTTDVVNKITFSGTGTITGKKPNSLNEDTATLTVDTTNAGFVNDGVTIDKGDNAYAVNIKDVCVGTFTNGTSENNAVIKGDVNIADANGTSFNTEYGKVEGALLISSNGDVKLEGPLGNSKITNGILVRDVAIVNLESADLSDAAITVTASNARIIVGDSTYINGNTSITAEAKDVRVTIPRSKAAIKLYEGSNGSFKAVTKANRDVTSDTDAAVTLTTVGTDTSKVADAISKLNVCTGLIGDKAAPDTTSRSAISGGALATSEVIDANIHELYDKDSDGQDYTVEVTYSLTTRNGLSQSGGVVTVTDRDAKTSDSVRVTIRVIKNEKVVNEIIRRMTFTATD